MRLRRNAVLREEPPVYEQLYQDGQSLAQIGRRFSRAPGTVRLHLLDRGVKMRPAVGPRGRRT